MYIHIPKCTYVYTYKYIHIYIYTHIFVHLYIYVFGGVQIAGCDRPSVRSPSANLRTRPPRLSADTAPASRRARTISLDLKASLFVPGLASCLCLCCVVPLLLLCPWNSLLCSFLFKAVFLNVCWCFCRVFVCVCVSPLVLHVQG